MKFGTKVTMGLLTIAGLATVYYGDNYFNQKKEEEQKEITLAVPFKKQEVLNFTLQNKNGIFAFTRENNSSPWKIIQPENLSPEQSTVNSILNLIEQASVQQELTGEKTSLAKYGLDHPRLKIIIGLLNKKNKSLLIGNALEMGEKSQTSSASAFSSAYGFNPDKKGLLVINYSQIASLDSKSTIDFISKQIGNFDEKDVTSIEIKSKSENVFLTKEKDIWPEKTEQFLTQYKNLFAENLFENPRLSKNILENPAAVVTLKNAANKIVQIFYLGIDKNGVYLNMQSHFVGKVGLAMWSDLVPTEKYLKGQ